MTGDELLPLLPAQHGIWVAEKLGLFVHGENNVAQLLEIKGALDPSVFREAVEAAVNEADGSHMRVVIGDDGIRQRWAPPHPVTLECMDFSGEPDPPAAAISSFHTWRRQTIGVDDAERYRFALIRLGTDHHAWAGCCNHFIIDHRGWDLLTRRVRAHFAQMTGLGPPPPPPPSFLSCLREYAASLSGPSASQAQKYWREKLASLPPLLWADRANLSAQYARSKAVLAADDGAKALASALGVSWPQLLTAFAIRGLARKFRRDCALGVVLDLRPPAYREAIGLFAKPLPLVVTSPLQRSLAAVAREVGAQLRSGYRWARFPILEAPPRGSSLPVQDALFNFLPMSKSEWANLAVSHAQPAPFLLNAVEDEGHIEFRLDHDTGALSEAEAAEFLAELIEDFDRERQLYAPQGASPLSRAAIELGVRARVDPEAAAVVLAGIVVTRCLDRETAEIAFDASGDPVATPRAFRFASDPEATLEAELHRALADPVPLHAPDAVIHATAEGHVVDWRATTSLRIAQRLDEAFRTLAGADLGASLSQIAVIPDAEVVALLARGQGRLAELSEPATLPALFSAQVARTPEAIALVDGEAALDYRGLGVRVDDLAAALARAGARRGDVVAVIGRRDIATIVALLAVQAVGAAFLTIDPLYPTERVDFMLADAAVSLVLDGAVIGVVSERQLQESAPTDAGGPRGIEAPSGDDLAYVMYTSGSTGNPKGVAVPQRALANFALWGAATLSDDELRGMLFTTSLVFDVAMFEIFSPLVCGGRVLIAEGFSSRISAPLQEAARVLSGVPTVLDTALRSGALPPAVSCIVTIGEVLTRDLADRLLATFPQARLMNAYGPTETTVYASFAEVRAHERGPVPIGVPITNMSLYVLDRRQRLLPAGVEGDLWIGGVGVARGYLNRPELNADRFLPNPFGLGRIYRSGDRARWSDRGELEFLGREDTQLKIHGVRVEAGEIQEALIRQPEIAAAAVGIRGDGAEKALIAWIVPRGEIPEAAVLRRRLAKILPGAAIPSAFVTVPQLPVTLSGKLDMEALPDPIRDIAAKVSVARAPSTPAERDMFELWRETIHIPAIRDGAFGVDDNLFDLGADSLSAVRLVMEIGARYGVDVPAGILHDGVTVAALTVAVQNLIETTRSNSPKAGALVDDEHSAFDSLVLVRSARGLSRGDVVGLPALDGSTTVIGVVAANAFDNYDVWAFRADATPIDLREGVAALEHARAFAEVLASERDLRLRAFVGYSFGGAIAWLTDRELVARGFPATPVINLEGYVGNVSTSIWREPMVELLARAPANSRGRMLLLQRASPAHYEISGPAEAEWRSLGLDLAVWNCRTLTHVDLEMPQAIRAAAPVIADFIEFARPNAPPREIPFDVESFGGGLFRLANGPQPPTASELRDFLGSNGPVADDGVVLHALFALAEKTEDPSLILEVAEIAFSMHPDDAVIVARLADARITAGDFEGSARAYLAALTMEPASVHFREALAHARLLAGQTTEAVNALREAFRLGGGDPWIYKRLGDDLAAIEQVDDAEWAYRAAIQIAPHREDARVALANLLDLKHAASALTHLL